MTPSWWPISNDPDRMLQSLRGRASDRKLRLYACACCRRIWDWLDDPRSRAAVQLAEQVADGAGPNSVAAQAAAAQAVADLHAYQTALRYCYGAARSSLLPSAWEAAEECTSDLLLAAQGGLWAEYPMSQSNRAKTAREQSRLLREIFGAFGRPPSLHPAWLTKDVTALARRIDKEQCFDRLPELADLLASPGCSDAELLSHCRNEVGHMRGCWAVDAVLQRA
jgi:hypothetical protein